MLKYSTSRSLLFFLGLLLCSVNVAAAEPYIERLTWAGVKISYENTTVFVDAVGTDLWDGNAPEGLVTVSSATARNYALISHAHNDHFDVDTLNKVLGDRGYAIVHESMASYAVSRGLKVIAAKYYVPVARGEFLFTAVPAEDGLGDEQVNWVISVNEKRYFHGGDTLWHGGWEMLGRQYGPFEIAFLPINGAKVQRRIEVDSAISMTPPQAVDAARLLRANLAVPIHYGLNDPPYYVEYPDALNEFLRLAESKGLNAKHYLPGERINKN